MPGAADATAAGLDFLNDFPTADTARASSRSVTPQKEGKTGSESPSGGGGGRFRNFMTSFGGKKKSAVPGALAPGEQQQLSPTDAAAAAPQQQQHLSAAHQVVAPNQPRLRGGSRHKRTDIFDMPPLAEGPHGSPIFASASPNVFFDPGTFAAPESTRCPTRARLVLFFREHDPPREATVDELLDSHRDDEETLLQELVKQYGPEPEPKPSPFLARFEKYYEAHGLPTAHLSEQLADWVGMEEQFMQQLASQHGPESAVAEAPFAFSAADDAAKTGETRLSSRNQEILGQFDNPEAKPPSGKQGHAARDNKSDDSSSADRHRYAERRNLRQTLPPGGVTLSRLDSTLNPSRRTSLPSCTTPLSPLDAQAASFGGYSPVKQRLLRFYFQYNPEMTRTVDKKLEEYRGREDLLFERLVAKYGPEPENLESSMKVDDDTRGYYLSCLHSASPTKSLSRLGSIPNMSPSRSPSIRSATSSIGLKGRIINNAARVQQLITLHPRLPAWDSDYARWVGQVGTIVKERPPDCTVAVVFADGKGAWFPKSCIELVRALPGSSAADEGTAARIESLAASYASGSMTGMRLPPMNDDGDEADGSQQRESTPDINTNGKEKEGGSLGYVHTQSDGESEDGCNDHDQNQDHDQDIVAGESPGEEELPLDKQDILADQYMIESKHYCPEYSGCYVKLEGETANHQALWERKAVNDVDAAYLYCTPQGTWRVTNDKNHFETGEGLFQTNEHNNKPPHLMGRWLDADGTEDKNITVQPLDQSHGDRVMGGHLILARVANELSEEELQYASFQRRRKFRSSKSVPMGSRCTACRKFEAVCSRCYANQRKAERERRDYLRANYKSWDLRRQVGVFFSAVAEGEEEDVKVMTENGADVNWLALFRKGKNEDNKLPEGGSGVTPLHVACAYHKPDVARALIYAGARYRKDHNAMFPLDYITDDDVHHDILMYLNECTTEYRSSLEVQQAWDKYQDGDAAEALNHFFELLLLHPTRDTVYLGLMYCHLHLGDVDTCMQSGRTALAAKDVQWIECSKLTVQKLMDRATEVYHAREHEKETDGCIKPCGCIVYPKDWKIPLRTMRKLLPWSVVQTMFTWLPSSTAFNAWVAFYRSPLLRASVDAHVTEASRRDKKDATSIITRMPSWLASLKEAVVDQVYAAWDTKLGELALAEVETGDLECQSIPTFPYFMIKVTVTHKYAAKSTVSRLKNMLNMDSAGRRKKQPGSKHPLPACDVFTLRLGDPNEDLGMDVQSLKTAESEERGKGFDRVRVCAVTPNTAACRSGLLPGFVRTMDGKDATTLQSFMDALRAFRSGNKKELAIGVEVDVVEGCWVEGRGLTKQVQLNGMRGYVTEVVRAKPPQGTLIQVNFGKVGVIAVRPSNLIFHMTPAKAEDDDFEATQSSSVSNSRLRSITPEQSLAFNGTVTSGESSVCTPPSRRS
ncbi:hypothetical protein DIPPA_26081 [Diplonema papillatum]|nr:hypothetical protein DIPPA_26081 [Diplonema papillatum]